MYDMTPEFKHKCKVRMFCLCLLVFLLPFNRVGSDRACSKHRRLRGLWMLLVVPWLGTVGLFRTLCFPSRVGLLKTLRWKLPPSLTPGCDEYLPAYEHLPAGMRCMIPERGWVRVNCMLQVRRIYRYAGSSTGYSTSLILQPNPNSAPPSKVGFVLSHTCISRFGIRPRS